jgi:signal transduction histidine kinase
LIQTSLCSVQQSFEREHRFLRHTSHELRTPISIIRNNIELAHKIKNSSDHDWSTKLVQIIDRIDRASLNMQHLTETLLWLSRDALEPLPEQKIDLDPLIRQLADEMRYLLSSKAVELELSTEHCKVTLPEIAARIVLGNLIRNAF